MTFYKTIYLINIFLCLMGYTDSAKTSEDQDLCIQNIKLDFKYYESITADILSLPQKAFTDLVFNTFITPHGLNYYFKIIEKAAIGLTKSPKEFCQKYERSIPFQPFICMEQLRQIFQFTDETDTLAVIKWTYAHITESSIPETFMVNYGHKVMEQTHFAFKYFHHMYKSQDLYISFPWPVTFCRQEEPHDNFYREQNYKKTDENQGESSRGEREPTIKELRRAAARERLKKQKTKTLSLDD